LDGAPRGGAGADLLNGLGGEDPLDALAGLARVPGGMVAGGLLLGGWGGVVVLVFAHGFWCCREEYC